MQKDKCSSRRGGLREEYSSFILLPSAFCLLLSVLPSAFCLLLLPSASPSRHPSSFILHPCAATLVARGASLPAPLRSSRGAASHRHHHDPQPRRLLRARSGAGDL